MYKIIGENNKVRYGCIDEAVDWNIQDFKLLDFFDKEVKGLKKRLSYHKFNFIGINSGPYVLGIAVVDLGAIRDVFAYIFSREQGLIYSYDQKMPAISKHLVFPDGPDEYHIEFRRGETFLSIKKSHSSEELLIEAFFENRLKVSAAFRYGLECCSPLRVLNPSLPTHWTFTEKYAPLGSRYCQIDLDGRSLELQPEDCFGVYDWSGGFLRRETNWYWASLAGRDLQQKTVGANFAALVNETYYPENAYWIAGKRQIVPRIRFDFDNNDLYKPWQIFNTAENQEEGAMVDICFTPFDERADKLNFMPLSKLNFRQFIGSFSGRLRFAKKKDSILKDVPGFCEIHRAIW